ncbi:hypothetical protein GCM10023210_21450 [Chryseobacterium ginsengisoli]|uniref:Tetratricopeptide repeat protein n=1 Tax=Chryseobacterium ginsengisoli TaxID=363853 RepID=A0ABP9MBJ3_9FLAO
MNHRVLELLKTPKNIQSEDLNLLKEEINSFPYVQNIRALYLYGVHLYDKENYQRALSTTAAYTTDKKILYQLINGKIQQRPKPEIKAEIATEKIIPKENPLKILYQTKASNFPIKREEPPIVEAKPEIIEEPKDETVDIKEEARILPTPREEIKHLYVNGERNRILFDGEDDFLDDNNVDRIDLESTLESGSIVTQKAEKIEEPISIEENSNVEEVSPENGEIDATEENQELSPEIVIEEEKITSEPEKEEISDEPELNLQETETADNQIETSQSEEVTESETKENKPEEIADFTPETIIEEENIASESEKEEILNESDLNFHETESFDTQIKNNDVQEEVKEPETIDNKSENSDVDKAEETAEFTPEKIINEDKISSEKEEKTVQDESELSFHGMESFLPEVKIQANNAEEIITEIPQSNINKHEDEMRRLIEEVEKKMKEKAASEEKENKKEEEPENIGHDISFAETQSFEVKPSEPKTEEKNKENSTAEVQSEIVEESKEQVAEEKQESTVEEPAAVESAWKPMSFESNLPDSLLHKSAEIAQLKVETEAPKVEVIKEGIEKEQIPELVEDQSEEFGESTDILQIDEEASKTDEETPVMNVSFFGSGWTIAEPEKDKKEESKEEIQKEKVEEIPVETPKVNLLDSNVPGFINTWQSWLKIDRAEEEVEEVEEVQQEKVELKNKVIETFIETNPRISQLKDEVSFVVKEKNDDISHLMTETLANLYFEQKLYTKAIKAFETLIKKIPEKKEYFEGKIQEIKDFRTKG